MNIISQNKKNTYLKLRFTNYQKSGLNNEKYNW